MLRYPGICGTNDRAESTDLEKIQNIDQNQNCMQKCCGLSVTQIQTGGIQQVGNLITSSGIIAFGLTRPESVITLINQAKDDREEAKYAAPRQQAIVREAAPVVATPQKSKMEQLKELNELKKEGILTEEEFAEEKKKVLAGTM